MIRKRAASTGYRTMSAELGFPTEVMRRSKSYLRYRITKKGELDMQFGWLDEEVYFRKNVVGHTAERVRVSVDRDCA